MTVEELVGDQVREQRERAGMSQADLGQAIGEYLGKRWTRQAVSHAENGRRDWRAVELFAVALVFGKSPGWLLLPKRADTIEFPNGVQISLNDLISSTITSDTPLLDTARKELDLLAAQLSATQEQIENARQRTGMVGWMLTREERKAKK